MCRTTPDIATKVSGVFCATEDRVVAVNAPPADKRWCYWITDASVVDFEEKNEKNFEEQGEHLNWEEFRPHILEDDSCIRDIIEHRYIMIITFHR